MLYEIEDYYPISYPGLQVQDHSLRRILHLENTNILKGALKGLRYLLNLIEIPDFLQLLPWCVLKKER